MNAAAAFIVEKVKDLDLQAVQLHGTESVDLIKSLRDDLGSDILIFKALAIQTQADLAQTDTYEDVVELFSLRYQEQPVMVVRESALIGRF